MIDLIVKSITKNLKDQYSSIPVISEDLPQNLPEPCFYISVLNSSRKDLLNDRFILNVPLDIHYFPSKNGNKKAEMNIKSMEVLQLLRNIKLYKLVNNVLTEVGMLHGFNFHTEIVDNVLHIFVEYKPTMNNLDVDDFMETLALEVLDE